MFIDTPNHTRLGSAMLLSLSLILVACGGGGGGDTASTPATTTVVTETSTDTGSTSTEADTTTDADTATDTSSEQTAQTDYTPDEALLAQSAETSENLYVDPSFDFNTFKRLTLDISATDETGAPLANTLLKVYAIDESVQSVNDPGIENRRLLSVAATDANGQIYYQFEVAQTVSNVLLQLAVIGIENHVIVGVTSSQTIVHQFN